MSMFKEEIRHHGGELGVTGSCHEWFYADNASIMVDCGLFQGDEAIGIDMNFGQVSQIKAVVITHGHIDHVGRLPWLIAAGYRGPIICTVPTERLLPLILEDALNIQIGKLPTLITATLTRLKQQLVPLEYKQPYFVGDGTEANSPRVTLQNAGHILGSAYVEIAYNSALVVSSCTRC